MRFGFSAEQRALAAAVREVLAAHCPPKLVRAGTRRGELWQHLADVGFFGMLGGDLGLTELDAVLVLEELGRAAAPGPLLETAFVAPGLLASVPSLAERWLAPLAAGEVAVALCLRPDQYAVDADIADLCLIAVGDVLHLGTPLSEQPGVDEARRLFTLALGPSVGSGAVAAACDRGALGTAAQLLGVAAYLLETTVSYAGTRRQFGRPVGQFQAVQHRLADVLMAIEFARPLVYRAAVSLTSLDVSSAAASAVEAAELAARAALQLHGAVGYTAELDLHLWLRRVWSLRAAWGSPEWHRGRVADLLLP